MNINRFSPLAAALAIALLSGCASKGWHAEGSIEGAAGKQLILEAPTYLGGWYPVDTVEISSDGSFRFTGEPAGHPEVYRLSLDGQTLYFPIDSLETVSITANAANFANGYSLAGSASADRMQEINSLINRVVASQGEQAVAYDPELKRTLAETILRDPAGIVAYYTIFRRVGDTRLFDPDNKNDLRLIGAVANAFATQRPSDPRTPYLADLFTSAKRRVTGVTPLDTLVAQEIVLPEIALRDPSGRIRSIGEEASKGKVLVLNFTAYGAQESPAFNVELARIYNAHRNEGLEIYQVGLDEDEFFWKEAASNLPWITVYNAPKDRTTTLMRYNVQSIPALFIINRNGELVERVEDISRLESSVSRYL